MSDIKRIKLPSGKTIEVNWEGGAATRVTTVENANGAPLNLHICPECKQKMVYPWKWQEHDDEHWELHLRCPDCETLQYVIAPQADCDLFDEELEDGTDILMRDYKRLVTANVAEEIERFTYALEHNHILPMDF